MRMDEFTDSASVIRNMNAESWALRTHNAQHNITQRIDSGKMRLCCCSVGYISMAESKKKTTA